MRFGMAGLREGVELFRLDAQGRISRSLGVARTGCWNIRALWFDDNVVL
jgi:hypothetical protein